MHRSDRNKIKRLHQIHRKKHKTLLEYPSWLATYFWDPDSQQQLREYLETIIRQHGSVTSVSSSHPSLQERTPIHLPYIYRHDLAFNDGTTVIVFQKYDFSRSFTSLFTSMTWSYLANLSPTFRTRHRQYEKTLRHPFSLVHPHPYSLWENYQTFLRTIGTHWKQKDDTMLGPVWIVLTDVTGVTLAVPGKHQDVGTSVYTHLIHAVHQPRFQKKIFETLGAALGKTITSCYDHKVAFVDVGLGNYIMDHEGTVRFIDGELLQVFPEGVPSHYKALELVMFMETLYLETVRDYCRTTNSRDPEEMNRYQRGLLVFFTAFLKELHLSDEELVLAKTMYLNWSTKASTFFFTFLLSLHRDPRLIRRYRIVLREDLEKILEESINKIY